MDEALDMRLIVAELRAMKRRKGRLPKGMRFAGEDAYEDPLPKEPPVRPLYADLEEAA